MKDFKEKFEILMDTVEKNLKGGTVLAVQDEAGKKMGEPGRKVGTAFSFITNMTINNYMTRRRYDEAMKKAISTVGEKSHIERAAAEFGYYDRSNFDNEVERLFGAKPAAFTSGEVEFTGMQKIEFMDLVGLQVASEDEDDFADRVTEIIVIVDHGSDFAERQKELLNDRLDCQAAYGIDLNFLEIVQERMTDYSRVKLAEICETIDREKSEALVNLQDIMEDLEMELEEKAELLAWAGLPEYGREDVKRNIDEIENRLGELRSDVYNIFTGDMSNVDIERKVDYWQELELSYKREDEYYDEDDYDKENYPYDY